MELSDPTQRRAWLEALGWTQRGFADLIGWDEYLVRRWFRGTREPPPEVDIALAALATLWEARPPDSTQTF